MSPLLNYTTTIEAHKTVEQIQIILATHGATAMLMEYNNGVVRALSFKVPTPHGDVSFRLPSDPDAVLKVLQKQGVPSRYSNRQQAVRVAWRIVKDWVEAQMALLETEMVRIEQIFLPYMLVGDGRTLYEQLASNRFELPKGRD